MFSADHIFNPIFELNLNLTGSCVVDEVAETSVSPLKINNVVFVIVIAKIVRVVYCEIVQIFWSVLESFPKFTNHSI